MSKWKKPVRADQILHESPKKARLKEMKTGMVVMRGWM